MKRNLLLFAVLGAVAALARADIALVPVRGPRSGSAFSTPGRALDVEQTVPVAMRSAVVDVKLSRMDDERLRARFSATFELEHLGSSGGPVEFMVAFPVTGLALGTGEDGSLALKAFDVSVDGGRPALVRRSTVNIGYFQGRRYGPADTSVRGALEGRFAPPQVRAGPVAVAIPQPGEKIEIPKKVIVAGHPADTGYWNGITLADQSAYGCAYLWTQTLPPGKKQRVVVTYEVWLRAQPMRTGNSRDDWSDPIRSEKLSSLDQDRAYFFFDYVLKSGATWEGPIGKETITLSAEDGISLDGLVSVGRKPAKQGKTWVWDITNEKPTEDVLVALPK